MSQRTPELPSQIRLSLPDVPTLPAEERLLAGDWYLARDTPASETESAVWSFDFPEQAGFTRMSVCATRVPDDRLDLSINLTGPDRRWRWTAETSLPFTKSVQATPAIPSETDEYGVTQLVLQMVPVSSTGRQDVDTGTSPAEVAVMQTVFGGGSPSSSGGSSGCTANQCEIDHLETETGIVGVGCKAKFTAVGTCTQFVQWSAPGANPESGTGATFETKWSASGQKTVTAKCPAGGNNFSSLVTVVAVDSVVAKKGNVETEGPVDVSVGTSVELRAKRTPPTDSSAWPKGQPVWDVPPGQDSRPSPFSSYQIIPTVGETVLFMPDSNDIGQWKVRATCCDSSDEIIVNTVNGCGGSRKIIGVSASGCFYWAEKPGQGGVNSSYGPMNIFGPKGSPGATIDLTLDLEEGAQANLVTWVEATQNPNNPLKATVPVDVAVRKKVTVKYNGSPCREIFVWPFWCDLTARFTGTVSKYNRPQAMSAGNFPQQVGGGNTLGVTDRWTEGDEDIDADVRGFVEIVGTLKPDGVGQLLKSGLYIKRERNSKVWRNGGHYVNGTWMAGPDPDADGTTVPDTSYPQMMDLNPSDSLDKIYDNDPPGGSSLPEYRTLEYYSNFRQWVIFTCPDGSKEKVSSDLFWYYRARVDHDLPEGKVQMNDIDSGSITLPAVPHYTKR